MNKTDAKRLMNIFAGVGELLNAADPIIRDISDEKLKKELLNSLGGTMIDLWIELQKPIVTKFPDLNPDE